MIYFRDNESWVQFGQQRLDDPNIVVIDLMGCVTPAVNPVELNLGDFSYAA